MIYRFKGQKPALNLSKGSKSKVQRRMSTAMALPSVIFLLFTIAQPTPAADKLIGIHSARVLSQSIPWIATETGLFKKYNIDFDLVFIASSPSVTAAMLGGDAEISLGGGEGPIRAYVQGASDFVFVGGFKNVLTHSILARADIKRPADLKGKKIGINRVGSNPHYFAVQALRRSGIEPAEVNFIQSGGAPETLVALLAGGLDAASLNPPTDAQAIAKGLHYVIYGPDLRLPYAATVFFTRRSLVAKRQPVIGQFLRAMLQDSCRPLRFLYRHRGHCRKAVGIFFEELFNALIVDAAPALRLFTFQIITEKLCARIERRQRDLPFFHHLQPPLHIGQPLHQRIPWTAVEGKTNGFVLILEDFDTERFTVVLRFTDYFFRDVMVMDINGAHGRSVRQGRCHPLPRNLPSGRG